MLLVRCGVQGCAAVALDEAPNMGAWVALHAVEALLDFGARAAFIRQRLELPLAAAQAYGQALQPVAAVLMQQQADDNGGGHPGPAPALQQLQPLPAQPPGPGSPEHDVLARLSGDVPHAHAQGLPRLNLLHPDQRASVQACCLQAPVQLLQGPPGTGKTETLAFGILALLHRWIAYGGGGGTHAAGANGGIRTSPLPASPPEEGGVVLVGGPTHAAIDNLMQRLAERLAQGALPEAVKARVRLLCPSSKLHGALEVGRAAMNREWCERMRMCRRERGHVLAGGWVSCNKHVYVEGRGAGVLDLEKAVYVRPAIPCPPGL